MGGSRGNLISRLVLSSKGILSNVSLKGLRALKEEELISARIRSYAIDLKLSGRYKGVFTHIPNEGKRSQQAARLLKVMGMVPGFVDWIFAGPWGNCLIEVKPPDKTNELRQTQTDFRDWCEEDDVPHFVCSSVADVESALISVGAIQPVMKAA